MVRKTLLLALLMLAPTLGLLAEPRNYLDTLPVFWQRLYPEGGTTLYCNRPFKAFDREVNVEHVYPMSWVGKALRCGDRNQCRINSQQFNQIESDMHNLYPALKQVNQARGSYPYAEIPGERSAFPNCDFEIDHQKRLVEPAPHARGRIARAMLYMADTYGLEIFKRQRAMLMDWHKANPPDEEEKRRNRLIQQVQGKANPYIQ